MRARPMLCAKAIVKLKPQGISQSSNIGTKSFIDIQFVAGPKVKVTPKALVMLAAVALLFREQ